ncbi:MAG TPA: N-acetyltransferase [Marinilabiliaceae bacterium]|nr:N-acetyltransferase [Marinilabiliaceae bacterium]
MVDHKGTLEIETERVLLRRFVESDAEDIFHNWASDSSVTRYLSWQAHSSIDVSKEILASWLKAYEDKEFYNWAIVLKEQGKAIGSVGVVDFSNGHQRCEIGYCIGKGYWNKGIMTEVLSSVIKFMISEVGFNRVQAIHHSDNPASGRVMIKAGMKHEGRLRAFHVNNRGEFTDCDMYSILKDEVRF